MEEKKILTLEWWGGTDEVTGQVYLGVSMILPDEQEWASRICIPPGFPATHLQSVVDNLEAFANKRRLTEARKAFGDKH